MKLTNFGDLPGRTDAEKCAALWNMAAKTKLHAQLKHNGISAIVKRPGDLAFITRNGKQWRHGFFPLHIVMCFHDLFDKLPDGSSIYTELLAVDDEVPLATLSGWVNVNRERLLLDYNYRICFMIYDIANDNVAEPFELRRARMEQLTEDARKSTCLCKNDEWYYYPVDVTYTRTVDSPEEIDHVYTEAIHYDGAEGVVYRVDPCFFFDGPQLSPQAFKRKKYYEVEGTIIGAIEGLGKRTGMLGSFIVKLANGKTVCAGGGRGIDDETLAKWWKDRAALHGLPITIRYEELSKDGTPLRIQIVAIRTYE